MLIEGFLNYLQYQKRYSAHTVKAYRSDLGQFFDFTDQLFESRSSEDVTPSWVRSWMVNLVEAGHSNKTIHRKVSSLKSFYRYLRQKKGLELNPCSAVVLPKLPERLPKIVKSEKVNHLLDNVWFDSGFEGQRDKLIIEILYGTGMRLSELINLQWRDIDWSSKQLNIIGKGNKQRQIPLSDYLSDQLSLHLGMYKEEKGASSGPIFLTNSGKKLYPNFVHRLLKRYLGLVTGSRHKNPHALRHTFATELLNNGADLNAIKELLGHASLAATEVYTHNSMEKIKQAYRQAHPRAKSG